MKSESPSRSGIVLLTLILVSSVANLNMAVANVALPDIARAFDAGQASINLIAVGFSLGLATSVLYLGAIGDRYGRRRLLLLGMTLSIPASVLAGLSPSIEVLFLARVLGGIAAGMAYPTTLALITALWAGPARTRSIALWSGIGGGAASLGPLISGGLLTQFEWGSVFFVTAPLAVVGLLMAWRFVPANAHETSDPVDHLGGILSVLLIAALVMAINLAPLPGQDTALAAVAVIAVAATVAFVLRQRRAPAPLFDLAIAGRRIFWVAALAGIIVFGSLMGTIYIGQLFVQDVLEYSALEAGLAILPAAAAMILVAPHSARLVESRGSRFTLLLGFAFCLLAFVTMLLLWSTDSAYWRVGLAYVLLGIGVGFAGTPASRSLTDSVPVQRAGMASATSDLQRDLGGAIMQSLLGAILTAGYAASYLAAIAASPQAGQVSDQVQTELTRSYASAANTAEQYPEYANQIIAAARASFLDGSDWGYLAGMIAVLAGTVLVYFTFPGRDRERELLASYASADRPG